MHGKVGVVTGGAGGIGAAICARLADAGATVVLTYRTRNAAAAALVKSLAGTGHFARCVDVTDSAALGALAAETRERLSRCDVLVNCAGTTRFVPHADLDGLEDALIDEIFRTNWRGAFAAVRAFRPLLAQHGDGLVVNISSVAAKLGTGSNVAYCASKAAMDCMTKSLARALAPRIRVVSVSPGLVNTEFIRNMDQAWRDDQLARTPIGRLVSPEEIGDAVVAAATLLQPLTGCVIAVDGGRPLA
ncbi:MAG: SDR family oxidoreductase [Betaproteobacteria bacterium]|nr:MAG: SDR family oxidoreductase [Betaproteobacteria bacterium]